MITQFTVFGLLFFLYRAIELTIRHFLDDRNISFNKLSNYAKYPVCSTSDSMAYDLFSLDTKNIEIKAGESVEIKTGIQIDWKNSPENIGAFIKPRSGMSFKQDIETRAGVIDRDYDGELIVKLYNYGSIDQMINIKKGIAQLVFIRILPINKRFMENKKRIGGFGSTD